MDEQIVNNQEQIDLSDRNGLGSSRAIIFLFILLVLSLIFPISKATKKTPPPTKNYRSVVSSQNHHPIHL